MLTFIRIVLALLVSVSLVPAADARPQLKMEYGGRPMPTYNPFTQTYNTATTLDDICRNGCVVLANDTHNYNITGVQFAWYDDPNPVWVEQFKRGYKVAPKKAIYLLRGLTSPDCEVRAKVTLQHRKTKEVLEQEETLINLCGKRGEDVLLSAKVLRPEVELVGYN